MPLQDMQLLTGASASVPTGGTAMIFEEDGVDVKNGVHLHVPAVTDFRVRPNVTFKNRNPSLLGDGTYSKGKRTISFVIPKELASGLVVFNLIRMEVEIHPETTAAEVLDLCLLGSQLLSDTDTQTFLGTGSLK